MKKDVTLNVVSVFTEKAWISRLNYINREAFGVHEINLDDQQKFISDGFFAGQYLNESRFYSKPDTFKESKLGKTKCFLVESVTLKEIVCAFCIKAYDHKGFILVEIEHLCKERRYESLVKYLGYQHYGREVFERFAIPLAQNYCRELNGRCIFANVPQELVKHFTSSKFKVASKKIASVLRELHEDSDSKIMLVVNGLDYP